MSHRPYVPLRRAATELRVSCSPRCSPSGPCGAMIVTLVEPLLLFPRGKPSGPGHPTRVETPRGRHELGPEWRAVIGFHPAACHAALRLRDPEGLLDIRDCSCLSFPGSATFVDVSQDVQAIVDAVVREWTSEPPEFCLVETGDGYEVRIGPWENCPGVAPERRSGHHTLATNLPTDLFGRAMRSKCERVRAAVHIRAPSGTPALRPPLVFRVPLVPDADVLAMRVSGVTS